MEANEIWVTEQEGKPVGSRGRPVAFFSEQEAIDHCEDDEEQHILYTPAIEFSDKMPQYGDALGAYLCEVDNLAPGCMMTVLYWDGIKWVTSSMCAYDGPSVIWCAPCPRRRVT